MSEAPALTIRPATPPDLEGPDLRRLFLDAYRHFEAISGRAMLRDGGFDLWAGNYALTAGRSRLILLAEAGRGPVAFIEGVLKHAPAHAPAGTIGFVGHVFTAPEARGRGVATMLYRHLEAWFAERGAETVELQIVSGNRSALDFWLKAGFAEHLLDLHKPIDRSGS